ncbi:MAG TPA: hypothetical protein VH853_23310 [Polyangia bacterium]|nr:hypothetical protein [Polyangia bacterium]
MAGLHVHPGGGGGPTQYRTGGQPSLDGRTAVAGQVHATQS